MAENPDLIPHHAPDDKSFDQFFEHIHPVELTEGGILHRAYNEDELQHRRRPLSGRGQVGLRPQRRSACARWRRQAISAEVNGAPVLAVQWHPEWKAHENPQKPNVLQAAPDARSAASRSSPK